MTNITWIFRQLVCILMMSQQPYSDRPQPMSSNLFRAEPPGANSYPAIHDGIRSNAIADSVFTSTERSKFLMERNSKLSSENEMLRSDLHTVNLELQETRQEVNRFHDEAQRLHLENQELRRLVAENSRVSIPQPQQINYQHPQLASSLTTESYNSNQYIPQQSVNSTSMQTGGSGDRAVDNDKKTLRDQVSKQSQEIETLKSTVTLLINKIRRSAQQPHQTQTQPQIKTNHPVPVQLPQSNGTPRPLEVTRLSSSLSIQDLNIEDLESTNIQPPPNQASHGARPKSNRPTPPPRPSAEGIEQLSRPHGLTLTEHPSRPDLVMTPPYSHLNFEPIMMANDETLRSVSIMAHPRQQTESMEMQINTPNGSSLIDSLEAMPQLEHPHTLVETHPQYKSCPTCNQRFNVTTCNDRERFEEHALSCLDGNLVQFRSFEPEEERSCPMCHLTFPQSITQQDFENHVISHFEEDEVRNGGFEMVDGVVK